MLQPKTECRNKAQAKLKVERTLYVVTKSFSVATLWKKIWKKAIMTILNSITTMIKENSEGAVSRHYFPMSQHKKLNTKMNSVATRDSYVALVTQKMIRIQHKSTKTSVLMLRQGFENQACLRKNLYHKQKKILS